MNSHQVRQENPDITVYEKDDSENVRKSVFCNICKQRYYQLLKLLSKFVTFLKPPSLSEKESKSEFSKCALCLKCFSSEANLNRHSKTCRGQGLFFCDLCGTHASSLGMFSAHIKSEHNIRNNKFLKVNTFNPKSTHSSKKYKKSGSRNSANKEKGKTYHFL